MEITGHYTAKGLELSAKLLTGTALTITRVAAGGGVTALDAVTMAEEKQVLAVGAVQRAGATVVLPVTLSAVLAEADYTLGEVGVYAQDPEAGEILYRLYRMEPAVDITAGESLVLRLELEETVSETAEVVLSGTAPGLITEEDAVKLIEAHNAAWDAHGDIRQLITAHTANKSNPHGVTAAQAGAFQSHAGAIRNISITDYALSLETSTAFAAQDTCTDGPYEGYWHVSAEISQIQGQYRWMVLTATNIQSPYDVWRRIYNWTNWAGPWERIGPTATISSTDITAGTTALETGKLYLVYE